MRALFLQAHEGGRAGGRADWAGGQAGRQAGRGVVAGGALTHDGQVPVVVFIQQVPLDAVAPVWQLVLLVAARVGGVGCGDGRGWACRGVRGTSAGEID